MDYFRKIKGRDYFLSREVVGCFQICEWLTIFCNIVRSFNNNDKVVYFFCWFLFFFSLKLVYVAIA